MKNPMSDQSSTQSSQSPLSPEAQALQDAINNAFAGLAEAFKKLGEPRYTWAEIEAALHHAADQGWGFEFSRPELLRDVREELDRARAAKL